MEKTFVVKIDNEGNTNITKLSAKWPLRITCP